MKKSRRLSSLSIWTLMGILERRKSDLCLMHSERQWLMKRLMRWSGWLISMVMGKSTSRSFIKWPAGRVWHRLERRYLSQRRCKISTEGKSREPSKQRLKEAWWWKRQSIQENNLKRVKAECLQRSKPSRRSPWWAQAIRAVGPWVTRVKIKIMARSSKRINLFHSFELLSSSSTSNSVTKEEALSMALVNIVLEYSYSSLFQSCSKFSGLRYFWALGLPQVHTRQWFLVEKINQSDGHFCEWALCLKVY